MESEVYLHQPVVQLVHGLAHAAAEERVRGRESGVMTPDAAALRAPQPRVAAANLFKRELCQAR